MATIIQRVLKGSPLTLQEHDDNFNNLNAELATKATPATVDVQIATAINTEATARISGDAAEATARDAAIATANTATLSTAKTYTDSNLATEITNRNTAITSSITTLKGGVAADGDTLGKLRALITGTNSGTNTGDETTASIKTKLSITTLSGVNTGDQTLSTLGIPNVENKSSLTIRSEITSSNVTTALGFVPVNPNIIGENNGLATLDSSGLVPSTQLPSYVDDVLEFATLSVFPVTGIAGKIYVDLDTNKTYRWSGSVYVYITSGAVDSVAGKTGIITLTASDVGLGNVTNTSDASKPVSTLQAEALSLKANIASPSLTGIPTAPTAVVGTNTTQLATTAFVQAEITNDTAPITHVGSGGAAHSVATTSVAGFMSGTDKTKLDGIASGATANLGTVTNVTGTAPINSSGGTAPVITISAATTASAGSMSAGDKLKLDGITGTNTGDETTATIKTKLSITTLSGVNTGDQTTITGNAGTATKLQTPRTINGIAFDGSSDITIETGAGGAVGNTISIISENTLGVTNTIYVMVGSLVLTLPANPEAGNIIYFSNRSNSKTVVIARNGQLIMGLAEDMTINIAQGMGSLVFADATRGWVLL